MGKLKWSTFASSDEAYHIARYVYRGRNRSREPHSHAYAEVFWFESGQGWHEVNGIRTQTAMGDLIFIRPDDTHALWTQGNQQFSIVNLQFLAPNVDRWRKSYGDRIAR